MADPGRADRVRRLQYGGGGCELWQAADEHFAPCCKAAAAAP
jgi:hypothetical protein